MQLCFGLRYVNTFYFLFTLFNHLFSFGTTQPEICRRSMKEQQNMLAVFYNNFIALTGYLRSLWLRMTTVTACHWMSNVTSQQYLHTQRKSRKCFAVCFSIPGRLVAFWTGEATEPAITGELITFSVSTTPDWSNNYLWGSQPSLDLVCGRNSKLSHNERI